MQQSEAWRDLDQRLRAMQELLRHSGLNDPNLPLALFALKYLAEECNASRIEHGPELPVERMSGLRSVENIARMLEDAVQWEDRPFTDYLLGDLNRVRDAIEDELLSHLDSSAPQTEYVSWLHERAYNLDLPFGNSTPRELARMMAALARFDNPVSVFDPSCGSGSLLMAAREAFHPHSHLVGNEANGCARSWTRVRLAVDGDWNADIDLGEPGTARRAPDFHDRRFDVVLTNPPFGIQFRQDDMQRIANDSYLAAHSKNGRLSSELAYLLTAYHHLTQDGMAAVLVPLGVLFRTGTDANVREALVEEGAIDAVIALPGRLSAPATTIVTAIVILRRHRSLKPDGSTLFIDARQLGVRQGQKVVLDEATTGKILEVYRQKSIEAGFSALVEKSHIAAQDFSLDPIRYIEKLVAATVDVSARRDHIAALDRHSRQLLGEYETLVETLMVDTRTRR